MGCARLLLSAALMFFAPACADVDVPGTRNVNIPAPEAAQERPEAVNTTADSVLYLPLGRDVLVPLGSTTDGLPSDPVGPYELRGETLAGALQLILADYDVSLAFESDLGMTRTVTVANLKGPMNKVVESVCALANLYCAYENDMLVVKETQTFTVKIPPINDDASFLSNIASGLQAIIGAAATTDSSTRTIIYKASHRTAEMAERYFQRMRASTALIVFETYIWEVSLNTDSATGIRWDMFEQIGKFGTGITFNGSSAVSAIGGNSVSIGVPTTQSIAAGIPANRLLQFISRFGAAKTISQPQITVLSGSDAKFRAATEDTFVSSFSETVDNGQSTVAVSTSTIDTGLELTIASAWDNATVYATIKITLSDAEVGDQIPFGDANDNSFIQLPESTQRELDTQVRVRPGDSILIAGLVQEEDRHNKEGFGFTEPFIPYGRSATTQNTELVFLLRPRVVVYTSPNEQQYYSDVRGTAVEAQESFSYDFAPLVEKPARASSLGASPLIAAPPSGQGSGGYIDGAYDGAEPLMPLGDAAGLSPGAVSSDPGADYGGPAYQPTYQDEWSGAAAAPPPVPAPAPYSEDYYYVPPPVQTQTRGQARARSGGSQEDALATSVPHDLLDPGGL